MDLPYLNVRNADMTEKLPETMKKDRNVFFSSAMVYIKKMLAKAVKDAINAHEQAGRAALPEGLPESLRAFLAPNRHTRSLADLKRLHEKLTGQMHEAFALSHFQNQHFWNAILDPTPVVQAPKPPHYEPGDVNQVKLWVLQNAMLWGDHLEFVREKRDAYPEYLPEMPHRGPKLMHSYP